MIESAEHAWVNNAWLGLGDVSQIQRSNPLKNINPADLAMPGLHEARLMRNPEYLSFACKALLNIDIIPDQAVVLEEIWKRPFPMLVCSRGFSKSFLMALYAMLRCIFYDGTKVVIVGAAFRQSKIIFEYMETMWKNGSVYRSLCDNNSGPRVSPDRCTMKINNSTAIAIPIGSGEKIRGLRANVILCDEFKCLGYNTLVETNKGLRKIGDIIENKEDVLIVNRYGQLEKPAQYIRTPLTDVYKVTAQNKHFFKCSNTHQVLTDKGWKIAKNLTQDDHLIFKENNIHTIVNIERVEKLEQQEHLYDFYLPETHSFYGNGFIQHNSIPIDIYETVISGFAAVSSDPIFNVKEAARRKAMTELGIWTANAESKYNSKGGNQAIITGTASYSFESFAEYWKRYRGIIKSKGNINKLQEILGSEVPENFNWRDYSIIRIPFEMIPQGFMDEKHVMRSKATMNSSTYSLEFGAVFCEDSSGFFKRSLIESCVTSDTKPIELPSGNVVYNAVLRGNTNYKYVFGVDPAVGSSSQRSERDNFSVVVLELHHDHTRIVYTWSTNRKDFKQRVNSGFSEKLDFYGFCARKIRDLMRLFPCVGIAIDAQGGGISIEEALHDPDKMIAGELPLWPAINRDKPKDTDNKSGLHILHLCQFADSSWTSEANHGLKKDLEDHVLLFPMFDPVALELSAHEDKLRKQQWEKEHVGKTYNLYDTLEDCVMEIEELKDELSTIVLTRTGTGVNSRDRWDTPETKSPSGKKGRLRKDRYSALVMANYLARSMHRAEPPPQYHDIGGTSKDLAKKTGNEPLYNGPEWFTSAVGNGGFFGVVRSK